MMLLSQRWWFLRRMTRWLLRSSLLRWCMSRSATSTTVAVFIVFWCFSSRQFGRCCSFHLYSSVSMVLYFFLFISRWLVMGRMLIVIMVRRACRRMVSVVRMMVWMLLMMLTTMVVMMMPWWTWVGWRRSITAILFSFRYWWNYIWSYLRTFIASTSTPRMMVSAGTCRLLVTSSTTMMITWLLISTIMIIVMSWRLWSHIVRFVVVFILRLRRQMMVMMMPMSTIIVSIRIYILMSINRTWCSCPNSWWWILLLLLLLTTTRCLWFSLFDYCYWWRQRRMRYRWWCHHLRLIFFNIVTAMAIVIWTSWMINISFWRISCNWSMILLMVVWYIMLLWCLRLLMIHHRATWL